MRVKPSKEVLLFGLCILVLLVAVHPVQAVYQTDPPNDVWSEKDSRAGDYSDYIDIQQVMLQGSSILISVEGEIQGDDRLMQFFVLLSDDGDPSTFEAAMIFSFSSSDGTKIVHWTIGNPQNDAGADWTVTGNLLQLDFLEYSNIIHSESVVITLAIELGNKYYDWTPGIYDLSFVRKIVPMIAEDLEVLATRPVPFTTTTATETVPTSTATDGTSTSGTSLTATTSAGFSINGFSYLPAVLVILTAVFLRRQERKR
ncbi:MAG: hypothetical protein ACFFD4_25935 [Candidatus Odinarchaeota archaeon]